MNHEERGMHEFACTLIQTAGLKLKLARKQSVIKVREKTSQMDLVTEQDVLIEKFLVEEILEKYPGHHILAEESHGLECYTGVSHTEASQDKVNCDRDAYTWVIDPIDGTINYYRFGKDYAISLALYRYGSPVFGLVYDVANNVIFNGRHCEGALMNGARLNILPVRQERLNKAVVSMSLRTMKEFAGLGMDVLGMLSKVQAHRYIGCASLELCKVANGDYDLFISSNVYEWDVAAARIFLEQRGGIFILGRKEKSSFPFGKLLVAAYRSPSIWEEAWDHLPQCVRDKFIQ